MFYAERPSEVMGGAEGRTEGREEKREGRGGEAKGRQARRACFVVLD